MNNSVWFDSCGETAAQVAAAVLTRHGFRVVRSFDLRSALAAHAGCECPYHGTAQCNCQFVVLLIYRETSAEDGGAGEPVVVIAHSRDAQARVQIVFDALTRPNRALAERVMAALVEAALTLQAAPVEEVVADAG